ncbi:ankyrin repeat domain-containing protein [uncultured Legionella sp.]|uniref:ankyrin repeat domain-containing protein n=1 Tax=uncultured Legionella sp. TaxID=210934 RepID=UPI002617A3E1|nr:ankyrin repeat domain-containing protein [uncultured Legionella sp.]
MINELNRVIPSVRNVKKALEAGADINEQTGRKGYTPLMYVVEKQYDRIAEYLLRQGADPLIKNNENKLASELVSPSCSVYHILKDFELLAATHNNDLISVQLIIQSGAMINFQGSGRYSALMIAVEQENIELTEYLLSEGADLFLTQKDGLNVFDLALDQSIHHLLENSIIQNKMSDNNLQYHVKNKKNHFFSSASRPLFKWEKLF